MGKKQYGTDTFHAPVENLFYHDFPAEKSVKRAHNYGEVNYFDPHQKTGCLLYTSRCV